MPKQTNPRFAPRTVALAVHAVLLGTAFVGLAAPAPAAWAQDAAQARAVAFNVPAAGLEDALNTLARQAGVTLSFDPALVRGRSSAALQGTHTVDAALRQLLAGTGLEARTEGGAVVVRKAPVAASRDTSLPQVTVTGAGASAPATAYRVQRASAATKSDTALIDTPTSVTVITEAVMRDQMAQTPAEVLRNAPTVTPWSTSSNGGGTLNTSLRGFFTGNAYKDGLRINVVGNLPLDNIETIEVVKGPASVLYGSIQPGGLVAYTRKKPQAEPYRAVSVTLGSEAHKKISADITGPLGASGELSYRLVAAGLDTNLHVDHTQRKSQFIAPSLRYQNADWLVDAGLEYGREQSTMGYGSIPFVNGKPDTSLPRRLFLGHPDNIRKYGDDTAYVQATRRFGPDSSVTATYSHSKFTHEAYTYTATYDPGTRTYTATGSAFSPRVNNDEHAFELRGTHGWTLGSTRNILAAGVESRRREALQSKCWGWAFNAYTASIDAPDYSHSPLDLRGCGPIPGVQRYDSTDTYQKERALFVQNTTWVTDRLQVLAGLRHARIATDYVNTTKGIKTTTQKDGALTGRLGMLYKATPELSLYASYASSFEQLVGTRFDGSSFDPTEGRQVELGFKQELGATAFLTGSVFRLEQRNLSIPDTVHTNFSMQEGKARSNGAELEISGELLPRLNLTGGVAYLDNRVVGGPNDGRRLMNVYRTKASLWASYRLDNAWTLGGGAFHHGNSYANAANTQEMDPATLVDLAATWTQRLGQGRATVQFNLKNAFNKRDYVGYSTAEILPGRQLYVRLGYEF